MPQAFTPVAAIVLASGLSRRFDGGDKLLANLKGTPVAAHTAKAVSLTGFAAQYAVVANRTQADIFEGHGFVVIHNDKPEAGQGQSLSLGAARLINDGYTAACVCLADMPFVSRRHIAMLLGTRGDVVMSVNNGIDMPPAVFRGAALQELTLVNGDKGGKSKIKHANVSRVPLSDAAARDIDTVDDLKEQQSE